MHVFALNIRFIVFYKQEPSEMFLENVFLFLESVSVPEESEEATKLDNHMAHFSGTLDICVLCRSDSLNVMYILLLGFFFRNS